MAISQSLTKHLWEYFLLLHWLWVRTSLIYSFGCLTKPMTFFPQSNKHGNWWYTWNLELANTSSVWFCCAFSISICPSVISLLKCSWKGKMFLLRRTKTAEVNIFSCMSACILFLMQLAWFLKKVFRLYLSVVLFCFQWGTSPIGSVVCCCDSKNIFISKLQTSVKSNL